MVPTIRPGCNLELVFSVWIMERPSWRGARRWWIAGGVAVGALVWVYDFQLFLNPGGGETPIARAILRTSHLLNAGAVVWIVWPPTVLLIAGAVLGFLLSQFFVRR